MDSSGTDSSGLDSSRFGTETDLMQARRLGPYRLESKLGQGGMGEVYRALDLRLGRRVAIKLLTAEMALRPDFRERFQREARAISVLNHPHICTLHDI